MRRGIGSHKRLGIESYFLWPKESVQAFATSYTYPYGQYYSYIIAYVKINMGGTQSGECLKVATDIWNWAQNNNNWLTITHVP